MAHYSYMLLLLNTDTHHHEPGEIALWRKQRSNDDFRNCVTAVVEPDVSRFEMGLKGLVSFLQESTCWP